MRAAAWAAGGRGSKLSTIRNGRFAALAELACGPPLLIGLTSRCFVPQFAIVALLRYRLQVSFAHWTSASPVSRTARGEAPSHWARASCAPPPLPPLHQFPLKSCGFSSAETARKRFLLWKMGFSVAKIAPSPPYTPPGTIEARMGLALSPWFFDKLCGLPHGQPAHGLNRSPWIRLPGPSPAWSC